MYSNQLVTLVVGKGISTVPRRGNSKNMPYVVHRIVC